MKKDQKIKITYEPEADVLSWEVSKKSIDFAEESKNVVVHFAKDDTPVLIEVIEASKFLKEAARLMGRKPATLKRHAVAVR